MFRIASRIHGPAHDRKGFVYGHIARRHVGVRYEKSRGRKARNSSANDVSALVLDAFRRERVDAVVVPHARIPFGLHIV